MATEFERLPPPPRRLTEQGAERRLGVEVEFIGLDVVETARLVAEQIGGRIDEKSRYECIVGGDPAGDWIVELDFRYLKEKGRGGEASSPLGVIDEAAEQLLRFGAEAVVPVEVVSPPLPLSRLRDADELVQRLREAGGRGTRDGLAYAFGLHMNPEMPALDAATVGAYLRAFICLFEWLKLRSDVDGTRRLTPYIDPFPTAYIRHVVEPGYQPALAPLIDDYLAHNPTRNRALDMLPLFSQLDEERVRAVVSDPRVKPRPTLHYRLPNCELDRPGWGVHVAWRDWLQVEHLACESDRLEAVCAGYSEWLAQPLDRIFGDWAEDVTQWLKPEADL